MPSNNKDPNNGVVKVNLGGGQWLKMLSSLWLFVYGLAIFSTGILVIGVIGLATTSVIKAERLTFLAVTGSFALGLQLVAILLWHGDRVHSSGSELRVLEELSEVESALSQVDTIRSRMVKDQEEIDRLREETQAILAKLQAA